MTRTPLIAAIVGALVLTSAAAIAHDRGGARGGEHGGFGPEGRPGIDMLFERFDADGDGAITRAEIEAEAARRFAENDTNGDGLLSADEMTAAAEARRAEQMARRSARMVERLDTDGDGMVSLAEATAFPDARFFDRMDADGDGAVTQAEAEEARGHFRQGGHGPRGGRHQHRN